jgi:hypothetical protein
VSVQNALKIKNILEGCVQKYPAPFQVTTKKIQPVTIRAYFNQARKILLANPLGFSEPDAEKIRAYSCRISISAKSCDFFTEKTQVDPIQSRPSDQIAILNPTLDEFKTILGLLNAEKLRASVQIPSRPDLVEFATSSHPFTNVSISLENDNLILF